MTLSPENHLCNLKLGRNEGYFERAEEALGRTARLPPAAHAGAGADSRGTALLSR